MARTGSTRWRSGHGRDRHRSGAQRHRRGAHAWRAGGSEQGFFAGRCDRTSTSFSASSAFNIGRGVGGATGVIELHELDAPAANATASVHRVEAGADAVESPAQTGQPDRSCVWATTMSRPVRSCCTAASAAASSARIQVSRRHARRQLERQHGPKAVARAAGNIAPSKRQCSQVYDAVATANSFSLKAPLYGAQTANCVKSTPAQQQRDARRRQRSAQAAQCRH